MASFLRRREGRSAAAQSFSVSVLRDDGLRTRSFGSKSDAYDDFCPVNDANGRGARRGSGRLEKRWASPTSVVDAPDAYGGDFRLPSLDDDDALREQHVDNLLARFRASEQGAGPQPTPTRCATRSRSWLGRSDPQRNALDAAVESLREYSASRLGGAADEEPLPLRKKPRPLAVETPPRALVEPAARRGCVLREVTIAGRRYLLGADAIEPVVERVEAGDAGEALHFCKSRDVYVVLDALRNAGDVDTVNRAWKSRLDKHADAYAKASDLMLRSLEAAVANSCFRESRAVVVPQLRSTDTVVGDRGACQSQE